MSALYVMRYLGQSGVGFGSLYIGRGVVVGADAGNGRYKGTYTEAGGQLKGTVMLSASAGGAILVTGQQLPPGQSIPIQIDLPADFASGAAQTVNVAGAPVQVTFEKIGDVP